MIGWGGGGGGGACKIGGGGGGAVAAAASAVTSPLSPSPSSASVEWRRTPSENIRW